MKSIFCGLFAEACEELTGLEALVLFEVFDEAVLFVLFELDVPFLIVNEIAPVTVGVSYFFSY